MVSSSLLVAWTGIAGVLDNYSTDSNNNILLIVATCDNTPTNVVATYSDSISLCYEITLSSLCYCCSC